MRTYTTTTYTISLSFPACAGKTLRLAFFSDLHNCCTPEETAALDACLEEIAPDLVLCGGDSIVASPGRTTEAAVRFLQHVAAQYPLVVGTGNHEYRARLYPETYGSMYESYREPLLQTANLTLLENDHCCFSVPASESTSAEEERGGIPAVVPVHVYGFDLPRRYYARLRPPSMPVRELQDIFCAPDRDAVSILLSHNPDTLPACLEWGADLSLFGHYHGGILRFGEHRGLISPGFRLFPGNAHGHFQSNGKHGMITSGCGEHTVPVRIHNPREVVGITIRLH